MLYHQLLIDLFQFLAPFLRNVELAKQTYLLYKVCMRKLHVMQVLYVFHFQIIGEKKFHFYFSQESLITDHFRL